ncbi:DNA polymerase III subunit delta [Trichocoleus sp. FACHB-262]|uniref:DNA polymerase III subunit delta n=1 Tax=Trichocoleus sp. FACHB-262 TaxID=2692869 RepID=UPI001682AE53|nr:DNA polymerase III subunit delta [Trichocoleus sp. FACHB-262]MBD2119453.1 DNA polymerase III subunit delta [Trichocoleus sp. FACHB-262]
MPIYLYWGEDDFAIAKAVTTLRDRTLDPDWTSFNFDKISAEQSNAVLQALTQAMTPPFGMGKRLVWLENTTLGQQCPETVLAELERTLPAIPDASVLLLTARNKPDGRLKSTKLLQKYAEIKEFSPIPPWKTDQLLHQVRQVAQTVGVTLTQPSMELLAESVGNNSRQLYSELEKLRLYAGDRSQPLEAEVVARLVVVNTQNSLQLAAAIRQGQVGEALELVAGLLSHNEPALRVVATLIGQFRTWLWVKLMQEAGERDERAIAQAAEVSNPKRIYFLQQEVRSLSSQQLQQTLPLLLELELSLKQGAEELTTLQTKVVELCQIYQR